eukprot:scaffold63054_cov60-Phaeocystis_antarctica.AAC.4
MPSRRGAPWSERAGDVGLGPRETRGCAANWGRGMDTTTQSLEQTRHGVGEGRAIRRPHYPPSARNASSGRIVGGAPAGTRPASGGDLTAALPTRPREGDVCEDVLVPRGGLSLHAQGYKRGLLGRTQLQSPWVPSVQHLDLSLVRNVQFRVARPSACVRLPSSLLSPSLGVGPWVGSLPFVAVPRGRSRRPVSLWRLLRRPHDRLTVAADSSFYPARTLNTLQPTESAQKWLLLVPQLSVLPAICYARSLKALHLAMLRH